MSEGDLPNIEYRSIPRQHLRQHPLYIPLYPPGSNDGSTSSSSIDKLNNAVNFRLFAEDTVEWNRLHFGRLTTSKLAAYVGLYEKKPSHKLNIPGSLRGHEKGFQAVRAIAEDEKRIRRRYNSRETFYKEVVKDNHYRNSKNDTGNNNGQSKPPFITRAGLEEVTTDEIKQHFSISTTSSSASTLPPSLSDLPMSTSPLWELDPSLSSSVVSSDLNGYPPLYKYNPRSTSLSPSNTEYVPSNSMAARLQWGSVQEEIGILTALNHLVGKSICTATVVPLSASLYYTRLYEVGLCCLECLPSLPSSCTNIINQSQLPSMGATPDGLLMYGDGTIEVVEVKTVSPFRENENYSSTHYIASASNTHSSNYRFIIGDRGPQDSIGPWIIPQLQMEILCAGPLCTGANLVSVSATRGARIFFVPRNDEYICLMLQIVSFVWKTYGQGGNDGSCNNIKEELPKIPHDYGDNCKQYNSFVDMTLRLARTAQIRANIHQEYIQRSPLNRSFFIDQETDEHDEQTNTANNHGTEDHDETCHGLSVEAYPSISLEELERKLFATSLPSEKTIPKGATQVAENSAVRPSTVGISSKPNNIVRNSLIPSQVLRKK